MSEVKGTKFDTDKAKLHMIPEEALLGMAQAFMYGAKKYDRFNYRKGLNYTQLTDSLQRHLLAFLNGEDLDPESGLPHTFHLLANAAMIEFMRARRPEMDDRYKEPEITVEHISKSTEEIASELKKELFDSCNWG